MYKLFSYVLVCFIQNKCASKMFLVKSFSQFLILLFLCYYTNASISPENPFNRPKSTVRPKMSPPGANFTQQQQPTIPKQPISLDLNRNATFRRQFIVNMTREAWKAYTKYAWGQASLKPLTLSKQKGWLGSSGTTIVSSMSTLWLMGLMDEFALGREWIEKEMKIDDRGLVKIGALLSCFALTGDLMFRDKAQAFADKYNATDLKLHKNAINQYHLYHPEYFFQMMILRDWINQRLEYRYLSDMTGEAKYWDRVLEMENFLEKQSDKEDEPYKKENWPIKVKAFLQSNGKDTKELDQYYRFIKSLEKSGQLHKTKLGVWYIRETPNTNHMNNRYCYFGSLLTLGQFTNHKLTIYDAWRLDLANLKEIVKHLEIAKQITGLCHGSTKLTKTRLPPFRVSINDSTPSLGKLLYDGQGGFGLNPDMAESFFVLYRLTRDEKYRDYAWQFALAIYRNCRTDSGGYAPVRDSDQAKMPNQMMDNQPADFLSATLKYLYLTFSPEELVPLDKWIFNADGHPLPICGANIAYPSV